MPKKFNYKAPSIIALTLAGTALTTHHAHASEKTQDQTPNKNVLNDDSAIKQSEQIKSDVSNPTTNVSGTQVYQDPTVVKNHDYSNNQNYDAKLDNLHNNSTSEDTSNNQQAADQSQEDTTTQNKASEEQSNATTQNDEATQQNDKNNAQSLPTTDNEEQSTTSKDETEQQNAAKDTTQNNTENHDVDATETAQNDNIDNQSPNSEDKQDKTAIVAPVANTDADDSSQKSQATKQNAVDSEDNQTKKETATPVATTNTEDNTQKSQSAKQVAVNSEDNQTKKETTSPVAITNTEDNTQKSQATKQNVVDSKDNQTKNETTASPTIKAVTPKQPEVAAQVKETTPKQETNAQTTASKTTSANKDATATATPAATTFRLASVAPQVRSFAATNTAQKTAVKKEATTKAKTSLPKYTPQVKSSINDYIRSKNYAVPKYEEDIASYLPKYSYRNGKPEGIVMHDTANDSSTIQGEVNYMKNNYNSAFVHAYVDGNRVIETANTDYLAWGAGPAANERFIHVELVHTHSADDFARSINNYADYAATNLQYYGLKPDSAEYDGQGTVWTHRAVSNYLGGTDHSDPHDYLQSHGYSYDELYDLINEKYLIKTGKVAAWGTTSSGSTTKPSGGTSGSTTPTGKLTVTNLSNTQGTVKSTNKGLYTSVYDTAGKKNSTINGKTYQLSKKATLGSKSFYLITDNKSKTNLGWMQTGDITVKKPAASTNSKLTVTALKNTQGTVKSTNHGVYTTVYDKAGVKNSNVNGKTYQLSKKATLGSKSFYLITDNKSKTNLGWLQTGDITVKETASAKTKKVTPAKPKAAATPKATTNQTQNVSKIGQTSAAKLGIKASVYDKTAKDGSKYAGKTFNVTKQRKQGNSTYVLIQNSNNGTPIGWVDTKNINTRNLSKTAAKKGQYVVKSTNSGLYAIPWGTKSQVLEQSKNLKNKTFTSSKSVFVDKDEYVYGTVNNKTGWIALKDLGVKSKTPVVKKPTTKAKPVNYSKAKKQNLIMSFIIKQVISMTHLALKLEHH